MIIENTRKDAAKVDHFSEVFAKTHAEADLTASIFHWEEVFFETVKIHKRKKGIER